MSIQNLTSIQLTSYDYYKKLDTKSVISTTTDEATSNSAVVYETSIQNSQTKAATYTVDLEKVKKMKEETDQKMVELFKRTVTDSSLKQFGSLKNIFEKLGKGESVEGITVTAEQLKKAQEDIAPGGYWSAESTSDRFLDFAKALSGGDSSKADLLMDAFKQGYEEATELWGDDLPDISKETYKMTLEKFKAWKTESKAESKTE